MRYEVNVATGAVTEHPDAEPSPEEPAVAVDRVSARQFKMQLQIAGIKELVEGWIAAQGPLVQIAYENSGTFVRSEPMMLAGFAALGLSEQQIEEFFTAAAAL